MGYDDLKVIEAKKFLVAVTGGEQRNSTIQEALADAEVIAAAAASAVDGQWHKVPQVPGATFGHTRRAGGQQCLRSPSCRWWSASASSTRTWSNPVLGGHCRFVAEPTEADLAQAQGAIVRADARGGHRASWPAPRGCGSWPGPESASSGSTWTPPPPVGSPS